MYNLALKDEVAAMAEGEDWPSYVRRITQGASPKDIAQTLHVNRSLIDRWLNKESRPATENVVALARAFHGKPVEALVAAGYLDQDDVNGAVEIVRPLSDLSDDVLISELRGRLRDRLPGAERPIGARGLRQKPKSGRRTTSPS